MQRPAQHLASLVPTVVAAALGLAEERNDEVDRLLLVDTETGGGLLVAVPPAACSTSSGC